MKLPNDVASAAKLVRAERVRRGWSTTELADRARGIAAEEGDQIKLAQQLISGFEQPGKAKRIPSWLKYVVKAFEDADAGTVRLPDKVETGGELEYVNINVVPSHAGAGGGGTGEGDLVVAKMSRKLIVEELHGRPSDFELIDVRGDSMVPDFKHGDQVLYDKRDRDPTQPGYFVIWGGDTYLIKNLEKKKDGLRVFSTNAKYSDEVVDPEQVKIMGRPVWYARRL